MIDITGHLNDLSLKNARSQSVTELSSCIEAFEINLELCTSQVLKRVFINFEFDVT